MNKRIMSLAGVLTLLASGFVFAPKADAYPYCTGWQARQAREERRLAHMQFERQVALQRQFGPYYAASPVFYPTYMRAY